MMFNESKLKAICLAAWSNKGKAPYLAIEIGGAGWAQAVLLGVDLVVEKNYCE